MDKADMKRIGNRLRACRKQADLTQEELGEMVGFSKNHISGIERGLNVPTVHFLLAIHKHLHVTPDQLLLGTKSPATYDLTQRIMRLSDRGQKIINQIIDILLKEGL